MPAFKGRAIIYPGLLIAGWIVGRSISLSATPAAPSAGDTTEGLAMQGMSKAAAPSSSACPLPFPIWERSYQAGEARSVVRGTHFVRSRPQLVVPMLGTASKETAYLDVQRNVDLGGMGPAMSTDYFASTSEPARALSNEPAMVGAKAKRLQVYGYSFWRQGTAPASLAPNAQYGGSQYGTVVTWDAFGTAGKGPALLLRGSGTPDGQQREVAIGARWQPSRHVPLSLSLERRFRVNSPDGFVAYVAGGADQVPIVGRLALDAYGQAGYSLDGQSSPFVDAQARLQYPLAKPLGIPIRIGAGAWVGGQKGAFRGDLGPTVSADIDARLTKFTLQLDWRKRVVGNAAPDDGLALTVSTGF